MQLSGETYEQVRQRFRWEVPERFNIAEAVCWRHARGGLRDAPALIYEAGEGRVDTYTFGLLATLGARARNSLAHIGIGRGDVVGIHLPQSPEALIAHLGVQALGAVSLPLFGLFGPEAMAYRLTDSAAKLLITTTEGAERLAGIRDRLSALRHVVTIDGDRTGEVTGFWPMIENAAPVATPADTHADDPAVLIYTSGTTGDPKGVVHAQRVLLGHLPGVALPQDLFPQPGDRFWTPADWAWIGGLFDVLLPSLYWGVPVVARKQAKFDPEEAFDFMARHGVRNVFMPPTALRMMRQVPEPGARYSYNLRSLGTGGESLGEDMLAWGRETFGLTMNEFYGQTEVNLVVGNCSVLFEARAGSMGRAIPGHEVAVVDGEGQPLPPGEDGIVAVRRPDPVMFLEYLNKPEATRGKFAGDWCLLGDIAAMDEDGYFWFRGRDDDIIISAGYRIGPGEIEACLMRHPDVALAGVIGVPDDLRGQIVMAFVVPAEGVTADDALAERLKAFVRERLAAHEYPRRIRFIDAMPLTVTGKIRRRDLRAMAAPEQNG